MMLVFLSVTAPPALAASVLALLLLFAYLVHVNHLLSHTPADTLRLSPRRWTRDQVRDAYERLRRAPIDADSYASRLPPRLDRRYIVTGGSGELTTLPAPPFLTH